MKYLLAALFYVLLLFVPTVIRAQFIGVDDRYSAQQLADVLTAKNPCVITANPSVSGDSFSGTKNSYGYFTAGGSSFPFSEGIILSSGSSTNGTGPFVRNQGDGTTAWKGDADLDRVLGIKSVNATVLEFDFIPVSNFISFNYIFASNEYQDDFPCRFSDGFAFLIKENNPNSVYKNLAVLPNTITTVSSLNVRPEIKFTSQIGTATGCPAQNQAFFGQLNTSPTNASPINFSGQTVVLNAQTDVVAGNSYHIKLVIADDRVQTFDSAVLIQAASFVTKLDLGTNRLLATNNAICFGQKYLIDTKLPANYNYNWYKNNVLITGENKPTYQTNGPGTYKVEVGIAGTTCTTSSEIKIEYIPEVILMNTRLTQCADTTAGIAVFDLTKAENTIKNKNTNLSEVVYYRNSTDAQANQNQISNPSSFSNSSDGQVLIAKVLDSYGCSHYAELTLAISNKTIPNPDPITVCDTDGVNDGIAEFNLATIGNKAPFLGLGTNTEVSFYLNKNDAYTEKNKLPALFKNTIPFQQQLFARINNGLDCYTITPITLIVDSFLPTIFADETIPLCEGNLTTLIINNPDSSYLWNTGANTNSIQITEPNDYSVTVTNSNGCKATKKFKVIASGVATITRAIVNDFAGNKNTVTIEFTGKGNYEFSIDGINFQSSPTFKNLAMGDYFGYARDKNGCGLSKPYPITILDYPLFFTPNGDGFNDTWKIENFNFVASSSLSIFDRYGKLIKEISAQNMEWDGTSNGVDLPSDDYWFVLNLEGKRIIKGHFSLIR